MDDSLKVAAPEVKPAEVIPVTDAELDAAAVKTDESIPSVPVVDEPEVKVGDVVVVEPTVPEPPKVDDTPKDNAESSKLGRRVSGIEKQIQEVAQQLNQFFTAQAELSKPKAQPVDELDPDAPLTLRELETYNARKIAATKSAQDNYLKNYVSSVYNLSTTDEQTISDEILAELDDSTKYGQRTGNPAVDAALNYTAAKATIFERKAGIKTNPLEKNKNKADVKTQFSGDAANPNRGAKKPELDKDAQAFVEWTRNRGGKVQLSDTDIETALTAPLRGGLRDMSKV